MWIRRLGPPLSQPPVRVLSVAAALGVKANSCSSHARSDERGNEADFDGPVQCGCRHVKLLGQGKYFCANGPPLSHKHWIYCSR